MLPQPGCYPASSRLSCPRIFFVPVSGRSKVDCVSSFGGKAVDVRRIQQRFPDILDGCDAKFTLKAKKNYPDGDIANLNLNTLQECACLCYRTCECDIFHWNQRDRACWLKSHETEDGRLRADRRERSEWSSGIMAQ